MPPVLAQRRAPLVRRRSGRLVAGVAGGIADHLGVDVLWVRAAFALLAALSGAGVVAYGLCWVFIRQEPAEVVRTVSRRERQQALGLAALGLGLAIASSALGGTVFGWILGPLGVVAVGAAVVWREADESRRRRWTAGARAGVVGGSGWRTVARVGAGVVFVAAGISVFLLGRVDLGQVQFTLLAVLATLIGVAVLTVPWWLRLIRELGEERRERIRVVERAEIAAHLHDSVLQTLALIQKQAEQPREVRRLARGQERELRGWLHGPTGYGGRARPPDAEHSGSLAGGIAAAAAEVEDTYDVSVRPVVVGDCVLDEQLTALVAASREAVVNAAKHAGVSEVSLYVEVEPDAVSVFVRDRGTGFDPDAVPADRHGLENSVHGRMERYGGTVKLRSAAGEGTEVQLEMPRQPRQMRENGS